MPDQDAIRRGFEFEEFLARLFGGKLTPGSGNKFYAKGDVGSTGGFLVQAKSQLRFYWPEVKEYLKEAIDDAFGSGNIGILVLDDQSAEKGTQVEPEHYVLMRLSDLSKAFADEVKITNSEESKGLVKRKTADIPVMLR